MKEERGEYRRRSGQGRTTQRDNGHLQIQSLRNRTFRAPQLKNEIHASEYKYKNCKTETEGSRSRSKNSCQSSVTSVATPTS
jgi:hypothetical protein